MSKVHQEEAMQFSDLAEGRRQAYAFLSSAFAHPPSQEEVTALRENGFFASATEMFSEKALGPLRKFAKCTEPVAETECGTRLEFMNLFKVPGAQYVTPYESVFQDTRDTEGQKSKGLMMGGAAGDVQKWYRLAALKISSEYKDLPDHISLELSYLAHLCAAEEKFASTADEGKLTRAWEMQRDFLAAHIVPWVEALCTAIHEKTQHPYFEAVAEMVVEFTRRDLTTLEQLLGPSNGKSAPEYAEA